MRVNARWIYRQQMFKKSVGPEPTTEKNFIGEYE